MTVIIKITSMFILLFVISCGNSVKKLENNNVEMIADGYIKGTILFSDIEGDCVYTIQVEDNKKLLLDPINLDENFMKNQKKIWFKYTPLKMKNRCDKANPISLIDTKKRS